MTYSLIGCSAIVFLAMVATGTSAMDPSGADLLRWGADYGPLTLAGEWWRPFTCMFVHIGVLHLALNMWCLLDLGGVVEHLFGRRSFLGIYLLTGLSGSVASLWWNPQIISAGASGAVFGVAGSLAAVLYAKKLPLPPEVMRAKLNSVAVFIGYNVFYGFTRSGIDNAAHLGGLAAGLLLGMLLPSTFRAPAAGPEPEQKRVPAILIGAALALVAAFWFVQNTHGELRELEEARTLVTAGQVDPAIQILRGVLEKNPQQADAHFLLGYAYLQKEDNDAAEVAFRRTLELQPDAVNAQLNLGVVYLRREQPDPAIPLLQKAAAGDPTLWQAHFNLGLAYIMKNQPQAAIQAFEQSAAAEPRDPDTHAFLGRAYLDTGQADKAIASFHRALKLKPTAEVYGDLAGAYAGKGMKKEADEALARQAELQQAPPQ